jgi:transglutaminase-like putative cysteine protease
MSSTSASARGVDAPARHLPVAEFALVGVTTAAVVSFSRLFQDWSFFWPMIAVVAYSHLVTMILRRHGVSIATSAVVSTLGFIVLASWLWFASSTFFGVPAASTWTAFTTALHDSWSAFQSVTAPVPVQAGFLVAAAVAVFFAVFLADWAAFRLWSPVESIIPALTLFVFSTLLGSEQQRMTSAFLFCATSLIYLLAHRVARLETSSGWLTADIERGSSWLLRAGIALTAVAVLGGVFIGPRLPTANDSALFDWRQGDNGGPSSRVTVSPLVDIRGRLVDQSDVEVFRVKSDKPAYWRLTALDTFDGQIWRSGGRYGEANGDLEANRPEGLPVERLDQRYEIDRLGALWLPAAYQPVSITAEGASPRYERSSSTLIVDTKYQNSDDLDYDVVSEIPTPTEEQLRAAEQPAPDDMAPYEELPDNFSPRARQVAQQVVDTAQASDPYGKALALQDFFRDRGIFADDGVQWEYALSPTKSGHDNSAIEAFLESHRGYCEMYAGTYAAMARSIGLPARVAVGFTWGDVDPEDPTLYHVKGRHAHAWPEVWLGDQIGWIAFEPTPGRGAPEMQQYNGITASQTDASGEGAAEPSTTTSITSTSSTTTPPTDQNDLSALLGTGQAKSEGRGDTGPPFVVKLGIFALVLLGLVVLYAVLTLGYEAWRRRRRRDHAIDPASRIALAWEESLDELGLVGVVRKQSETRTEFAHRAGRSLPERVSQLDELAELADFVTYSADEIDDAEAVRADEAAMAIAGTVHARVARHKIWLNRLDPRRVLRATGARPRQQAQASRG